MPEPTPTTTICLHNRLDELDRLHAFVAQFSIAAGLPDTVAFALSLAIDELVTNVILHGYDDHAAHTITVALRRDDTGVVVEIEDDGRPFDPTQPPHVDLALDPHQRPIGGLGLHFVRRTMDEMAYDRRGAHNCLRMKKRTPHPASDDGEPER